MKPILAIAFLLCWPQFGQTQEKCLEPIGPHQMVSLMGRGVNLGNTLEAQNEGNWQAPAQEYYFDDYVDAGFSHVRLPVRWDRHTLAKPPYTIDASWLQRVEEVIDWALARELVVVLNAHHEHWLLDDFTPANIARFEAIWTQIAEHFQHKSSRLLFEVINEPYFELSAAQVDELNTNVLSVIRVNNPTRIVLLTGGGQNSNNAPLQMAIPDDDYVMAYFHYYKPFEFTNGSVNNWGSALEKATVREHFDSVKSWADANNITVLLGEFGVDNTVDASDRAEYYRFIADLAVSRRFAFSAWEVGTAAKGFYNREQSTWETDVLDGLIHGGRWGNGVRNPGFELAVGADWSFTVSGTAESTSYETSDVHSGDRALRIDVTASDQITDVRMESQLVDVEPAKSYVFGAYVRAANGATNHQIRLASVWQRDDGGLSFNARRFDLTSDYRLVGGVQSRPVSESVNGVRVRLQCGEGIGQYYFDDVHIIEATDFLNGSFEDGLDYVWEKNGIAVWAETADAFTGGGALRVDVNEPGANIVNPIRKFLGPNQVYGFHLHAKSPASAELRFRANYFDANEVLLSSQTKPVQVSPEYERFAGTLLPPSNTAYMTIEIEFSDSETYIVDDVVVECISNPVEIIPASINVTRGQHVLGGASEISESDNEDLSIRRLSSDIQSITQFEVGAYSPVDRPSALSLGLEGAVFSRTSVVQRIEMFNFVDDTWELVDERVAARFNDSIVSAQTTAPASFVGPNRELRSRVTFLSTNPRQNFSSNTDRLVWVIAN